MAEPKFPKYTPPKGYTPPKEAGKKTDIGKGNRPAPQRAGESDADFQRRSANWMKSYQARGGVKIAEMNQGQLNKFAASGGPRRGEMINSRIGQYMEKHPSGSNPPAPPGGPDMSAENPSAPKPKPDNPGGRTDRGDRGGNQGMTASGGSARNTGGFGGSTGALGALARMPGRRARRRARRMAGGA